MGGHSGGVICGQLIVAIGRPLEALLKPKSQRVVHLKKKIGRTKDYFGSICIFLTLASNSNGMFFFYWRIEAAQYVGGHWSKRRHSTSSSSSSTQCLINRYYPQLVGVPRLAFRPPETLLTGVWDKGKERPAGHTAQRASYSIEATLQSGVSVLI